MDLLSLATSMSGRLRRVWMEQITSGCQSLGRDEAHYLSSVLRIPSGTRVELFDGEGHTAYGVVDFSNGAAVHVDEVISHTRSGVEIDLYQGIIKGDRWDFVLEKAGELGVARVFPMNTQRTVVKVSSDRRDSKLERWAKIATSAARQSCATFCTQVMPPIDFSKAITTCEGEKFFGDLDGSPLHRWEGLAPTRISFFVGPEGGFDDRELSTLASNAHGIWLGPRVLRAETAALTLVTLAQSTWGDWR